MGIVGMGYVGLPLAVAFAQAGCRVTAVDTDESKVARLRAGEDFGLAFSPERVDPGRTDYTIRNTPKVVGGLTPACRARAEQL